MVSADLQPELKISFAQLPFHSQALQVKMASPQVLALPGSPVFSAFRLAALKEKINNSLEISGSSARATAVTALWVHYLSLVHKTDADNFLRGPPSKERKNLEQLLTYGDLPDLTDPLVQKLLQGLEAFDSPRKSVAEGQLEEQGQDVRLFWVSPRTGTISPWSSKATSIAHVCGLEGFVSRIERGLAFAIAFEGDLGDLKDGKIEFGDLLHDRMTQVCYECLRALCQASLVTF
jgi:phosphoribosylformylglycinamidine synthase